MKENFPSPKVSVIMPVYNSEKYLAEAIDSILAQTFQDFEIVAVYDISSDNSLKILRKYAREDSRLKIIVNPEKRGLGYALNQAMQEAQGKYFARFDSDDVNRPYRFKRQVHFL